MNKIPALGNLPILRLTSGMLQCPLTCLLPPPSHPTGFHWAYLPAGWVPSGLGPISCPTGSQTLLSHHTSLYLTFRRSSWGKTTSWYGPWASHTKSVWYHPTSKHHFGSGHNSHDPKIVVAPKMVPVSRTVTYRCHIGRQDWIGCSPFWRWYLEK